MIAQTLVEKKKKIPRPAHEHGLPGLGGKAITGALTRMSTRSNHPHRPRSSILSPLGFGDWDDWDNGHSDGPSS